MNELIKITKNESGEQLVSGRELHEYLEVKTRYNDWFSDMIKYGFTENVDYIGFTEKRVKPQGGRPSVDHALTLDMAKEVSMIQRTDKGKEARQYFIEVEKQQKAQVVVPTNFAEALRLAADLEEEKLVLQQQIAEYEPRISYLDKILSSTDTVTTSQIAADYGMSAQALNKQLHALGVQHKVGGQWLLYKKHMNQGYTKSHTSEIPKAEGGVKVVMNTKWTQKGRLFIYELLKNEGYYPQMDLEQSA